MSISRSKTAGCAWTSKLVRSADSDLPELIKLARETQEKIATADRDLSAARAEIAALKSTMEKLDSELAQMQVKAGPDGKK